MGLYVKAENSAWKPIMPKEVCQGIEYQTAVTNNSTRDTFKSTLKFLSSAPYDSSGSNYITLATATVGGTNTHTCTKRKNTNGYTWRNSKANVAINFPAALSGSTSGSTAFESPAISGGFYKPTTTSSSKYTTFTT